VKAGVGLSCHQHCNFGPILLTTTHVSSRCGPILPPRLQLCLLLKNVPKVPVFRPVYIGGGTKLLCIEMQQRKRTPPPKRPSVLQQGGKDAFIDALLVDSFFPFFFCSFNLLQICRKCLSLPWRVCVPIRVFFGVTGSGGPADGTKALMERKHVLVEDPDEEVKPEVSFWSCIALSAVTSALQTTPNYNLLLTCARSDSECTFVFARTCVGG